MVKESGQSLVKAFAELAPVFKEIFEKFGD
jgi:hypothetical protein